MLWRGSGEGVAHIRGIKASINGDKPRVARQMSWTMEPIKVRVKRTTSVRSQRRIQSTVCARHRAATVGSGPDVRCKM